MYKLIGLLVLQHRAKDHAPMYCNSKLYISSVNVQCLLSIPGLLFNDIQHLLKFRLCLKNLLYMNHVYSYVLFMLHVRVVAYTKHFK